MKEQYIKQVEKELSLTRKAKKEVVRDLNEVFASALEHGETEQQVIERLGTPKEFAENTAEQLGIDSAAPQKRKGIISSVSIIEEVSEEIEGQDYVSIGTLLSNGEKGLSISYIPDNFTIYISFLK